MPHWQDFRVWAMGSHSKVFIREVVSSGGYFKQIKLRSRHQVVWGHTDNGGSSASGRHFAVRGWRGCDVAPRRRDTWRDKDLTCRWWVDQMVSWMDTESESKGEVRRS